jgi:hypothetical protein
VRAKPGYVVGGVRVDTDDILVRAAKVIFMRAGADGRPDPRDRYESDWVGNPTGVRQEVLGGGGEAVVGTFGRRGLTLDAFGLLVVPRAAGRAPATAP